MRAIALLHTQQKPRERDRNGEFNNQPSKKKKAMKKMHFSIVSRCTQNPEFGARGYLLTLQAKSDFYYYCAPRFVIGKQQQISEWKMQIQTIFHLNDCLAFISYWTMHFLDSSSLSRACTRIRFPWKSLFIILTFSLWCRRLYLSDFAVPHSIIICKGLLARCTRAMGWIYNLHFGIVGRVATAKV